MMQSRFGNRADPLARPRAAPGVAAASAPAVSVIIPTRDRAAFLRRCLASIHAQTFTDYEIIVVDDGSSDETPAVGAADPRVCLVYQQPAGVAAARNTGVRHARGRYLAYCDDDDLWYPDHLRVLVSYLDAHPEVGLVYGDANWIDDAGAHGCPYSHGFSKRDLEQSNYIHASRVVHRRECAEVAGGFDETLAAFEDWDLWLRIADHFACWHVAAALGAVTWHGDNLSAADNWMAEHAVRKKRELHHIDSPWRQALLIPPFRSVAVTALWELGRYCGIDLVECIPQIRRVEAPSVPAGPSPAQISGDALSPRCRAHDADVWRRVAHDLTCDEEMALQYEQVLRMARRDSVVSCLDYGSRIGSAGLFFAAHGFATTIADSSAERLRFCRHRLQVRDLKAETVDLSQERLPEGSYDLASASPLEIETAQDEQLERVCRALRPGGLLILPGGWVGSEREHAWAGPLRDYLVAHEYWQDTNWSVLRRI
jgi:GT2 family glycosyltransferase